MTSSNEAGGGKANRSAFDHHKNTPISISSNNYGDSNKGGTKPKKKKKKPVCNICLRGGGRPASWSPLSSTPLTPYQDRMQLWRQATLQGCALGSMRDGCDRYRSTMTTIQNMEGRHCIAISMMWCISKPVSQNIWLFSLFLFHSVTKISLEWRAS